MDDYIGLENMNSSISYMNSSDWKQRFIAEYAQLVTRIGRLLDSVFKSEDQKLVFDCPVDLLDMQVDAMTEYRRFLEIRADIYGIDLEKEIEKLNR